jgi:hypothetical protein
MILHQLVKRRQCLWVLQEWKATRVQQLERLHHELDFTNSAASEVDVAIEFA